MKKNNSLVIIIPIVAAVSVVLGILLGTYVSRRGTDAVNLSQQGAVSGNKIDATLSLIEKYYVEKVDIDTLVNNLMPKLMGQLDPHSVYIPPVSMERASEELEGEIEGIGVTFNMLTDTIVVLNVVSQGPSYKAGMQNGDRIIMINDSLVAGQKIAQDDVLKMLRGKRGTKVTVSVERQGISELVPITITRDKILLKSVDAAFMIKPKIGYLRLTTFSRNTHSEIVKALGRLREEGMEKLIFDIRDNTGGYLEQAILLANEFLPNGKLIVYTEDRAGKRIEEFSDGYGKYTDLELVMVIDEGSASSSEILAGALQDNDRGTIVGRRSFGKGLVQQQIPFRDGSAIRLTVARYFTPTGRSIQKPFSNGEHGYEDDIYLRYMHDEMYTADSIRFDENLKFTTPGGKTVYGGGGIMPDVFVPLDTTRVNKYFAEARGRNYIYLYSRNYADKHRDRINSVETVAQLDEMLADGDALVEDFVSYAASQGLKPDRKQVAESRELLITYLRAYIGRNTPLEEVGYSAYMYKIDETILESLKLLE